MSVIARDTFNGTAGFFSGRAPDLAPGGAVWDSTGVELNGAGAMVASPTVAGSGAALAVGLATVPNLLAAEFTISPGVLGVADALYGTYIVEFADNPLLVDLTLAVNTEQVAATPAGQMKLTMDGASPVFVVKHPGMVLRVELDLQHSENRMYVDGVLLSSVAFTPPSAPTAPYTGSVFIAPAEGPAYADGTPTSYTTVTDFVLTSDAVVVAAFWTDFVRSHEVP